MSVSECLFAATMAMVIVWVVAEVGAERAKTIAILSTQKRKGPRFQGRKRQVAREYLRKSVLLVDDICWDNRQGETANDVVDNCFHGLSPSDRRSIAHPVQRALR